jgi:cytidylate kinase
MKSESPFIITISRELGSGGSYIGKLLADFFKIAYVDREIIIEAAKKLQLVEDELQSRDENVTSFWKSFLQLSSYTIQDVYLPPQMYIPSDAELFKTESEVIMGISQTYPAVIIGRCGSYILRNHPRHIGVFLHSDIQFRQQRVQDLYHLSPEKALKMLHESDCARSQYFHKFTGKEWTDARQYNLSIDTSSIGLEKTKELIIDYCKSKF